MKLSNISWHSFEEVLMRIIKFVYSHTPFALKHDSKFGFFKFKVSYQKIFSQIKKTIPFFILSFMEKTNGKASCAITEFPTVRHRTKIKTQGHVVGQKQPARAIFTIEGAILHGIPLGRYFIRITCLNVVHALFPGGLEVFRYWTCQGDIFVWIVIIKPIVQRPRSLQMIAVKPLRQRRRINCFWVANQIVHRLGLGKDSIKR